MSELDKAINRIYIEQPNYEEAVEILNGVKHMMNNLLTIKEISERMKLTEQTIRNRIKYDEGFRKITIKIGRQYRVKEEDLNNYLNGSSV